MNAITGRVTDQNGNPLFGANVYFTDEHGNKFIPTVGTITDPDGYYKFNSLGGYYITVSYQGFKTQTKSIDVTQFGSGGGYTQAIAFIMQHTSIALPAFEIIEKQIVPFVKSNKKPLLLALGVTTAIVSTVILLKKKK